MRIAYLTGSFPSPTHTFFWREICSLRELEVAVDPVSTKRPTLSDEAPAWRRTAAAETLYLAEWTWREILRSILTIAARPRGLARIFASMFRGDGGGRARLAQIAAAFLAARLVSTAPRAGWSHVHVGFTENAANIALYAWLLGRVPYSVTLGHSISAAGPNQREKWRHAAFGVAISQYLRAEAYAFLPCDARPDIFIVPRGIDNEFFARKQAYLSWPGSGPAKLFVCARLTPSKGHIEILEAISKLRDLGYNCKLRVAGAEQPGSRGYRETLQQHIRALKLDDSVEFLGSVDPAQIRDELHQAHISIAGASPNYIEGWGNAIAESVAAGTPTVACETGGVVDTIRHEENGLLIPPGDSDAIAAAIITILENRDLAKRLSEQGAHDMKMRYGKLVGPRVLKERISISTQTRNRDSYEKRSKVNAP